MLNLIVWVLLGVVTVEGDIYKDLNLGDLDPGDVSNHGDRLSWRLLLCLREVVQFMLLLWQPATSRGLEQRAGT